MMKLLLKKISDRLRHVYMVNLGPIVRAFAAPPLPKNPDGKVLVHIGCGELNDARYVNLDARSMPHVHHVTQSLDLEDFPQDSIDLIYACHVLEHVSHRQLPSTLSNWFSRLKHGGILRLSVPDFDVIVEIYQDQGENINAIKLPLFGGQEYDFNYHNSVFNHGYLHDLLKDCGFAAVRVWEPGSAVYYDFDDWAKAKFELNDKQYKISLNLEAVK
jgi:SAM-dependent methyltransferase